jgi:hypothetical protein
MQGDRLFVQTNYRFGWIKRFFIGLGSGTSRTTTRTRE